MEILERHLHKLSMVCEMEYYYYLCIVSGIIEFNFVLKNLSIIQPIGAVSVDLSSCAKSEEESKHKNETPADKPEYMYNGAYQSEYEQSKIGAYQSDSESDSESESDDEPDDEEEEQEQEEQDTKNETTEIIDRLDRLVHDLHTGVTGVSTLYDSKEIHAIHKSKLFLEETAVINNNTLTSDQAYGWYPQQS